jgi:hypothetical protein
MSRQPSRDLHLPRYMQRKGISFYFVTKPPRKWIGLGDDLPAAIAEHGAILARLGYVGAPAPLPLGYTAATLLRLVKRSARTRGIGNVLTLACIEAMARRARGRCEVSGMAFSTEKPEGQRIRLHAPSVDRIDSSKGYAPENCRLVCAGVNIALNSFGDRFVRRLQVAARIAEIVEVTSTNPV